MCPANPFPPSTQNGRLYDRLTQGEVANHEIVNGLNILKYTSRLSDVRGAIAPLGVALHAQHIGRGSEWRYCLKGRT